MLDNADVLDSINAVDWAAIPGRAGWYSPECAAAGLRDLASATSNLEAAKAASRLAGGGIIHDHSGAVFPAAVVAAPFLLDILEHGRPKAQGAALDLLSCSLTHEPFAGYTRVDTPSVKGVPLCCAIAEQIRARDDALGAQGHGARSLLADTAEHWRFEVRDVAAEYEATAVFGLLGGTFPDGAHAAELHDGRRIIQLAAVTLEIPPNADSDEACLRLIGVPVDRVRAGAVLYPAVCGERVH
ncbi:hypothetical protein [Actinoallomurus liliacearum]